MSEILDAVGKRLGDVYELEITEIMEAMKGLHTKQELAHKIQRIFNRSFLEELSSLEAYTFKEYQAVAEQIKEVVVRGRSHEDFNRTGI
ncbi:DUF1871 family protein [Bacillus sp. SCS-153A]|uniref:DUF1871 family protein n=1 Tax=Rossellomorea sedimentorum TaxID=3115294 RepID=UPI00390581F6